MLGNVVRKEGMQKEYWKLGSEHDKEDLKQRKLDYQTIRELQTLEVLGMRKICVFGAAREFLPQIIVPKGGREAKTLFLDFLIFSDHCLTCYRKHKWKQATKSSKATYS